VLIPESVSELQLSGQLIRRMESGYQLIVSIDLLLVVLT